ncbi:zinc-alpha-2-glycoprotein-like [Alosa pseudoharengus]|uniref:zinc-alpha-2-glycoprotein-like n=1 Tax=Alosa pseudoharengus TaxID=34774 RepID=UPI003F88C3F8
MGIISAGSGSSETHVCVYLCLLICWHLSNGSDVDTLEVQYTVYRGPGGKLQFQQTTLFNGHVIFTCSSPTLRDQPKQDWVTHAFTQEELEDRHQQCASQCYEHFPWFEKIDETITVTAGVVQRRRGCITNRSGVFDKWAVDGEEFLTFDPQTLKWTPQTDEASHLATEWNTQDLRNRAYKSFGQNLCSKVHILKKEQAARPSDDAHTGMELHIFAKHIPGGTVTYLQCHVTDSDLSGLRIQLTKDGVPLASELKLIGPRPNGDGTVQMRVQVKITMDNSKTYQCEVYSEIFNKSVVFGDQSAHQITVIGTVIFAVVGTVTCVIVLIAVIRWWRQRAGFVRASTDENSSSSGSTFTEIRRKQLCVIQH